MIERLAHQWMVGAEFRMPLRPEALREPRRAVGEIEPAFGEPQQATLIRRRHGPIGEFDGLRGVLAVIVCSGHRVELPNAGDAPRWHKPRGAKSFRECS